LTSLTPWRFPILHFSGHASHSPFFSTIFQLGGGPRYMHYNLSGMLRVAFVLLLIRFTLATFQLRIQFRPPPNFPPDGRSFPGPFIKSGLTSNALCLFWRLLQLPFGPKAPHKPPSILLSFFRPLFVFCRVIFNSFTFCTSALCVTNCFCVAVFTIVLIHFLSSPRSLDGAHHLPTYLPPSRNCTMLLN